MTICMVISLLKIPDVHHIYQYIPINTWLWLSLCINFEQTAFLGTLKGWVVCVLLCTLLAELWWHQYQQYDAHYVHCPHTHTHTHTGVHSQTLTQTCTYTQTQTHTCTYPHTHTHTHTCTLTHKHTHSHICIRTYIHTPDLWQHSCADLHPCPLGALYWTGSDVRSRPLSFLHVLGGPAVWVCMCVCVCVCMYVCVCVVCVCVRAGNAGHWQLLAEGKFQPFKHSPPFLFDP